MFVNAVPYVNSHNRTLTGVKSLPFKKLSSPGPTLACLVLFLYSLFGHMAYPEGKEKVIFHPHTHTHTHTHKN